MNYLRRELAPISPQGWSEIDSVASIALAACLSARKFVAMDGPHGFDHACVPLGILSIPKEQAGTGVKYGVHQVLPLIETRCDFSLPIWELDNLERGAKGLQLDAVIKSCREMANFEERVIYEGFAPGAVIGLQKAVPNERIRISLEMNSVMDAISAAQEKILKNGIAGPANLVVPPSLWEFLAHCVPGGTLRAAVEAKIGGQVIYAESLQDALLIASRGDDLELTIGQDFAIGYHGHTATDISLFVTESFTFRVIAPEVLVGFTSA